MASSPPKKGATYTFKVALGSVADPDNFKTSVTLAAGDVKVDKDGAGFQNIGTLPTELGTTGVLVVALTATEMTADQVSVLFTDAAGDEWQGLLVVIDTVARQIDDLAYPTTTGRSIDVTAGGNVGVDWANVESPATTVGLSGTTVKAVSDAVTATVSDKTGYSLAASQTFSTSGSVGSVTGAVGSVTGAVDSVTDAVTVGAVNSGAITAAAIATGAIDADALAADAGTELADAVWTRTTRTLTTTAASTTAAVSGSTLTATVGVTYTATLTGLSIPATWTKVYLTVKDDDQKGDALAVVQVMVSNPASAANDGLQTLNGAAGTKANASLTVDQAAGTVAIVIADDATASLEEATAHGYDLKALTSGGTSTLLTAGTFAVQLTETRAIA